METFPAISENTILWHIEQLVRDGHDVELLPANQGDRRRMQPEVEELGLLERVHETPTLPRDAAGIVAMGLRALVQHPGAMVRLVGRVGGVANTGWPQAVQYMAGAPGIKRFDVMQGYFGPPARRAELLRWLGLVEGPLVATFLGFDVNVLGARLGGEYYKHLFERAERLTVSSRFMRGKLLALGAPEERLRLLPMGLPIRKFEFVERGMPSDGVVGLITVARLTEVKGVEFGLRAVALAVERGLKLKWDVVGDGPLKGELEALSRTLGLEGVVTFHGSQPMGRVRELLGRAQLCLFPGVRAADGAEEALGGAPIEAHAAGLPVLTTDAGGIGEGIVAGETGLIVPQRDAQALCDGLEELVRQAARWGEMGRKGRAHVVEHFDCERLHPRWMALYRELG
jgi:colanic acid/amylovoran biosynthesis glycosyltransferase